jgi:hypothetical protein
VRLSEGSDEQPLYTEEDMQACLDRIEVIDYHQVKRGCMISYMYVCSRARKCKKGGAMVVGGSSILASESDGRWGVR